MPAKESQLSPNSWSSFDKKSLTCLSTRCFQGLLLARVMACRSVLSKAGLTRAFSNRSHPLSWPALPMQTRNALHYHINDTK